MRRKVTERNLQRGRGREEGRRRRVGGEETEGKRQRCESGGKRQRWRKRVERYRRRDILEMDGKRQRGTDREEETERRGTGEQTEGNRQRGDI
jgi:hypothetical protein